MNTPLMIGSGEINSEQNHILLTNWGVDAVTLLEGTLVGYGTINGYEIFKIDLDDDDDIFIPNPITNDLNNLTKSKKKEYSKEEFLEEVSRLLENNKNLNIKQKTKLKEFLLKYKYLFAFDSKNPGATTKTQCHVNTPKHLTD